MDLSTLWLPKLPEVFVMGEVENAYTLVTVGAV